MLIKSIYLFNLVYVQIIDFKLQKSFGNIAHLARPCSEQWRVCIKQFGQVIFWGKHVKEGQIWAKMGDHEGDRWHQGSNRSASGSQPFITESNVPSSAVTTLPTLCRQLLKSVNLNR